MTPPIYSAVTGAGLLTELKQKCELSGGQNRWAERAGFTPQYVSDLLNGRREISEAVANALGYVRQVSYIPMRNSNHG